MRTFDGYEVRTSWHLTEDGTPLTVQRSWRERLRPEIEIQFPTILVRWCPWVASYTMTPQVPRRDALVVGNVLYIHPAMLPELERLSGRSVTP